MTTPGRATPSPTVEYLKDATSKVTGIFGSFVGHFQIPNRPGVPTEFTVDGISDFDSTKVDETQLEQNYFGVVSAFKTLGDASLQAAAFARYSTLAFRPDRLADVMFNGIAQRVNRSSIATGLQLDGTYALAPTHTLHAGAYLAAEQTSVQSTSDVLPAVDGVPTSDQPFTIFDSRGKIGYTYSVYLQDAWRILPTVTINGGVRLDGIAAFTNEHQWSPRLNVVWEATPTTTVHAGYARYFTPPRQEFVPTSTVSRFAGTTAESTVPINNPVRAERAHYVDAGITQQILPGVRVGLDAYYKNSLYHLDEGQFGAPTFLTPFNYHRASNVGIELTASVVLGDFSAYGNLAAAQQGGQGHRDGPGPLLARRPGLHPRSLHCHRPQPAHHRVGGPQLSLLEPHPGEPGPDRGQRPPPHRQQSERLEQPALPAARLRHQPPLRAARRRQDGGALRRDQPARSGLRAA
jgi:outer membrane receptor protein involved in Fe transport